MPIVGRIGRDAGVSGVGGAGVCAQGARAARAGGVLAVDGSADAQGARAGGSIRKRGTPLRRLQPSQFGIVVLQRCRLQNSLPHWRCIRLYLPQRRIARLSRAAIAAQPPLKGKAYEKPDGKGNGAAAQETEKNRRAEHGRSKSNAGGEKPAGTDFPA